MRAWDAANGLHDAELAAARASEQCEESRLYLAYISPISRLYLAYISPISPIACDESRTSHAEPEAPAP